MIPNGIYSDLIFAENLVSIFEIIFELISLISESIRVLLLSL